MVKIYYMKKRSSGSALGGIKVKGGTYWAYLKIPKNTTEILPVPPVQCRAPSRLTNNKIGEHEAIIQIDSNTVIVILHIGEQYDFLS